MKAKYNGYTFKLDETVIRKKVKFHNRYGIDLVFSRRFIYSQRLY